MADGLLSAPKVAAHRPFAVVCVIEADERHWLGNNAADKCARQSALLHGPSRWCCVTLACVEECSESLIISLHCGRGKAIKQH
eukprot:42645-Amphidinium_carterae.3